MTASPQATDLAARAEDAGLTASAPPEQRWIDGWLVRLSPGKAKRARCINALARGQRPLDDKLAECAALYRTAGLPMFVRITPYTRPAQLDAELQARRFVRHDDTRVMLLASLDRVAPAAAPSGGQWLPLAGAAFAQAVGALRGSPATAVAAHARRLAAAPVTGRGFAFRGGGEVVACGQFVREGDLVGLYDLFTREDVRGQGLASALCQHLLSSAAAEGARIAYLQVEADNAPARRIYHRLGFADANAYHYRQAPGTP